MLRATPESPRMFQSDFIDMFSRIPWWVVPMLYVPIAGGLLVAGVLTSPSLWTLPPLLFAGFIVWSLMEYWLHRTVFHWKPNTSWGPRFHFFLHGVHHDWVNDRLRLVMPPAASLGLLVFFTVLYGGAALALSSWIDPSWFFAFYAGKIIGYMNYDVTHYYIHHGKPKLKFYKRLRAHHNAHHFNPKFHDKKFGVSLTLWDHVFRTYS